jgi:hypothetical protein
MFLVYDPAYVVYAMDEWTTKTPNPKCLLFFKIYLLTGFAALCLTDFIDWRFTHGWYFQPSLWTKELYLCTIAPLSSLWPPPPPSQTKCTVYLDSVCLRGGRWGVELCCRPYSAGILHSVSDQIQNLPNCFTTPNKMTIEDDIKGLVSLKFLRPWWRLWPAEMVPSARLHRTGTGSSVHM